MNWLVWRQHRKQFVILAIILVLYTAIAIPTGLHLWHTYQQALVNCAKTNTCDQLTSELFQSTWESNFNPAPRYLNIVDLLILLLPFLLGMFVGVPLIAREYSEGTNLLMWTRSVSRRKWLTTKLIWTLMAVAIFAGTFAVITTWWSMTGNALQADRFSPQKFGLQGMAPVAYAIFAVSLGIALGAWLKRTMPAVGILLAVFLATQITIAGFIRPHYVAPITVSASMGITALSSKLPSGAWMVSRRFVDQYGKFSNTPYDLPHWPSQCQALAQNQQTGVITGPKPAGPADIDNCLTAAGYRQIAQYQPADRYWKFQQIEVGIYLAFTALALGVTYWLVLKRDA